MAQSDCGEDSPPYRPTSPPPPAPPPASLFSAAFACAPTPVAAVAAGESPFYYCARWSPCGLIVAAAGELGSGAGRLVAFSVPQDAWADAAAGAPRGFAAPLVDVRSAERVRDLAFHPARGGALAAVACSARAQPIHLFRATRVEGAPPSAAHAPLASFAGRAADGEAMAEAFGLAFSPGGERLYAGAERALLSFDVARPGDAVARRATAATRRSADGQRGIIAAVDAAPGAPLVACGSVAGSVAVYDERVRGRAGGAGVVELSWPPGARDGPGAGATQVTFSPDAQRVYVGFRRHGAVRAWDLRSAGAPCMGFARDAGSNQRISFSLDGAGGAVAGAGAGSAGGRVLLTGSRGGAALAYDTLTGELLRRIEVDAGARGAVNSAALHPCGGVFAVAVGERDEAGAQLAASSSDEDAPARPPKLRKTQPAEPQRSLRIFRTAPPQAE